MKSSAGSIHASGPTVHFSGSPHLCLWSSSTQHRGLPGRSGLGWTFLIAGLGEALRSSSGHGSGHAQSPGGLSGCVRSGLGAVGRRQIWEQEALDQYNTCGQRPTQTVFPRTWAPPKLHRGHLNPSGSPHTLVSLSCPALETASPGAAWGISKALGLCQQQQSSTLCLLMPTLRGPLEHPKTSVGPSTQPLHLVQQLRPAQSNPLGRLASQAASYQAPARPRGHHLS